MMKSRTFAILAVALTLSAGVSQAAVTLWTTTFTDNSAGANTNRAMVNSPSAPFADTLSATWSLTRSGALTPLFLTGTSNGANNFNPRQNVDNAAAASWQADFAFAGGASMIPFSGATFNIYRYNNSGNMQTVDAVPRTVNFTAWYSINGGLDWTQMGATQNVDTTASHITDSPANLYIPLNFPLASAAQVDLGTADFRIRFRAENDNTNAGANIGINSFVVSAIPEPSAALLGGFGLLGLLRRRR